MKRKLLNILKVLNEAREEDINEGRVAYFRYHEVMRDVQRIYNEFSLDQVVAVFVTLSPQNDYLGNLRSLVTVLDGARRGLPSDQIKVSTYGHCRDRALTYLNGVDFWRVTKGEKIRSFYRNILNPMDKDYITIDGHAVNIWKGVRVPLKEVATKKDWKYKEVAADYKEVARRVGIYIPNQIQAITWFAWKRKFNIIAPSMQLHFFEDVTEDFWRTLVKAEDIKPFPCEVENANKENTGKKTDNSLIATPLFPGNDKGQRIRTRL